MQKNIKQNVENTNQIKKADSFFISFYHKYLKISVMDIVIMALTMSLFIVVKYIVNLIFTGPLNVGVEIIFWIIAGIIFGPIKGALFSTICDTFILMFTRGIVYWMIEYAALPSLISIMSWGLFYFFKQEDKKMIYLSITFLAIISLASITIFTLQVFVLKKFVIDGLSSKLFFSPYLAYSFVIIFNLFIWCFVVATCILYYKKNDWKYIRYLYMFAVVTVIVILFRWIWGPYAFIAFADRFLGLKFDFATKYFATLAGIAMKSFITIPVATVFLISIYKVLDTFKIDKINLYKY